MGEKFEIKATVSKKLFYNGDSMFGVFSFEPDEKCEEIEINKWGNFVVNGNTPELIVGKSYEIIIEPSEHPKYGKGYTFIAIKQKKPTSADEQRAYIRAMLKEKQAEAIIKAYPNEKILDLMREDKFSYENINGIGKVRYENIKKFLFDHLDIQEALVELQDLKITFKAMSKLITHFGDARVVVQKIKENIYNLCQVASFGFLKVDQYALNRGDDKENPNRIVACIRYILDEESNSGHSWCSVNAIIDKAKDMLQIDKKLISEMITTLREGEHPDHKQFHFEDERMALKKYYFYEQQIHKKLIDMLELDNHICVSDVDERIKQMENELGITYTDEQKNAIRLANNSNVLVINGKGGTGKTFSLKGILSVLNRYSYVCCALSGKAAKIMDNHDLNAMTIHRLLGVGADGFKFNQKNRLHYDIVVIDEASMVNSQLFYSLLIAIKDSGKLIILGDNGQLEPIGVGAVFEDILKSNKIPKQELTIVQRQAQKSGILLKANEIREGNQINDRYNYERQIYGELKDFVLLPVQNKENILDITLEICKKYKHKDVNEFQVLTAMKSRGDLSVKKLNIEMQKIFNDVSKPFVKRGSYEYRIGDKVIQCGNNYSAGESGELSVFNGTLGKIVDIEFNEKVNKIMIEFEGIEEIIVYEKDELDMIELAYAITVHRSQGSTIKHVLFVFDYGAYTLLSRQFVYTGITRSSKACVVVCENNALHHAIRTNHAGQRRTFLYDLLMSDVNEK